MDEFDNTQAWTEGWLLDIPLWLLDIPLWVDVAGNLTDLACITPIRFCSAAEALEFVKQRASEGSPYHIDALARIAFQ